MLWVVGVFAAAFIRSFVATFETLFITHLRPGSAVIFGAINSSGCFVLTFAVVEASQKLTLIIPYVIGEVTATLIAILIFRRRKQRGAYSDEATPTV